MHQSLEDAGYSHNKGLGIWSRATYTSIAYNDGDAVEENLYAVLNNATDLSVLSLELVDHCTDWPSLYHLSSERSNLLRPLAPELTGKSVLEIGAGCGAITRYLGEIQAEVLALEGSLRRAQIARLRTRDLPNVHVLADNFAHFHTEAKFDVITLIGVLEYASKFVEAPRPHLAMLQRAYSLLKPGGQLIIAIENQLGLKYFAGVPEDHLSQPMVGLEGRYLPNGPETFGKKAMHSMLEEAAFSTIRFLYPFPDYKLPNAILTEQGMAHPCFDGSALASQGINRTGPVLYPTSFHLPFAWKTVFQNHLGGELSNSFLISAQKAHLSDEQQKRPLEKKVLGYYYASQRKPHYCKQLTFCDEAETLLVYNESLMSSPPTNSPSEWIQYTPETVAEYHVGTPLSTLFLQKLYRFDQEEQTYCQMLQRYLKFLQEDVKERHGEELDITSLTSLLPGEYIDAIFHNIILTNEEQWSYFDREWASFQQVPLGYILFRALFVIAGRGVHLSPQSSLQGWTVQRFLKHSFQLVNFSLLDTTLQEYIELEYRFQKSVRKKFSRSSHLSMLTHRLGSKELALDAKTLEIALQMGHRFSRQLHPVHKAYKVLRRIKSRTKSVFRVAKNLLQR